MRYREALNIVLVNLIVFFALISIHEMSHAASGVLLGCNYKDSVLMDSNFVGPYTEMYCSGANYFWVLCSSLIVTSVFSFLFLLLRNPTRNLFPISLGLSVVFSSFDVGAAFGVQSLIYPIAFLGFLITSFGEYLIASSYVNGDFSLNLLDVEREILE